MIEFTFRVTLKYAEAQAFIDEVERAIDSGQVARPQSAINGEVFWEWRP